MVLERMLPDTELTRRRLNRLLRGLEIVSAAFRVLLTIDDLDLLGELKKAVSDSIREVLPEKQQPPRDAGEQLSKSLSRRLEAIQSRLIEAKNPRIQSAMNVLSHLDELLNLDQPLPSIVLVDTIDFTVFKPDSDNSETTPAPRRRK
jgi:hypothetical protein